MDRLPPSARALLVLSFLSVPAIASAQFGLEHVISNISVANVNTQTSCLLGNSQMRSSRGGSCGLYGWGLEIALALSPDTAKVQYQFALGYGHIYGFNARQPNMDVHGVMRLAPEVSFYATRSLTKLVSPYIGLHTGLVTLNDVQVYATPGDTAYNFSANTLQLGATVGLSLPYNFYIDAGYRYRDFQSLQWHLPKGTLPPGWPKSLIMSAVQFTAGIQFDVGGITGKKK
ncbi:MAG TPA: hypothetical protein VL524_16175 [Gemmatimonadaceae bacterium]|jgi:opacity protein-like surface antigen|nr:hypothetical protein [Gemmatimonadaceae bacterium]